MVLALKFPPVSSVRVENPSARVTDHFISQLPIHQTNLHWLVVSNMAFLFHNIWDNPSHWHPLTNSYFSRWLKPPTNIKSTFKEIPMNIPWHYHQPVQHFPRDDFPCPLTEDFSQETPKTQKERCALAARPCASKRFNRRVWWSCERCVGRRSWRLGRPI